MSDTEFLIVRHPETWANVEGRFVGRGESPYTERGRRQFDLLAARIAAFRPDAVWSSPLARAHDVAVAAAGACEATVTLDDRLLELDFGQAEGLTWPEIEAAGLEFDYRSVDTPVAPGGESRGQIETRSAAFADSLVTAGGRHAVCTHGGVFRAMLVHLLGLSITDIWAFHIRNGAVAHVSVTEGHGMIEEFRVHG
ncbi:MAG: histidine phosphatase family protein [Anaerosomatales bacterium]|nr:histidine phosphatase family protein [Anaerosomatales bacterium]MDT8433477.1 histidine phosphatase family protein [Anaerosomatales bacterium]